MVLELEGKTAEEWINKGLDLFELKRYREAIECYDKALEINPDYDAAWYDKGLVLFRLKRYREAIECYDKALEINPDNDLAWYRKGLALFELKWYREAIECYDKALEITTPGLFTSAAWYRKGLALFGLKRYREAIECYDKALEITPDLEEIITPDLEEVKDSREKAIRLIHKAPKEVKGVPVEVEKLVYGYIVGRRGKIDVAKCAKELQIPKEKVMAAIDTLVEKGMLDEECE
ncbi:Cell division coordinator CpoB [subsurface metagenome]